MMSSLWIILAVWVCVNLAFIAIRLLVTAQSDEQTPTWGIGLRAGLAERDLQE
jgi:hypothetical protein